MASETCSVLHFVVIIINVVLVHFKTILVHVFYTAYTYLLHYVIELYEKKVSNKALLNTRQTNTTQT